VSFFSDFYVPQRSAQQAARRARSFYQQRYIIQIDIDLENFLADAFIMHPNSW